MLDSYCRSFFQKAAIHPLLKMKWIGSLNPIVLTFLGLVSGCSSFLFLIFGKSILAVVFLLLSGFFDVLDGSVARAQKTESNKGAALDLISDRFVEFLIILGLYWVDPTRGLYTLLMLGSTYLCVTSFFIVGLFSSNLSEKSFFYSPGLIERSEAFLFFTAMILFPSRFVFLSSLFSILVFFTAFLRLFEFQFKKIN
jgi:phosphatidylglycerophosphate synthase